MKLTVLPIPLLLASTAFAHAPLRRGVTTDTCANLDAHLAFPDVFVENKPYDAGRIHIGLCASQVDRLIGHYDVTEAATKVVGADKVKAALVALIEKAGQECTYPPHSVPSVTKANVCDFVCTDGFDALPLNHPTSCVCRTIECDSMCGHDACNKAAAPSRRRNELKCADGLTMCSVSDPAGARFKCAHVASDSSMCGGCVKAAPFPGSSTGGVDCRKLPNVAGVTCEEAKCVVQSCQNGFTVSMAKDACVTAKVTRDVDGTAGALLAKTVPGVASGKVPRSDATSPGKAALNNAQFNGVHKGKFPRGFAPVAGRARVV